MTPEDNITATEEEVQNLFGLEPNIDRPTFIPLPVKQEDGSREWTAPQVLYDAARAYVTPGVAFFEGGVTEEDVINFGLTYTGAGVASRITTSGAKTTARQIDDTFLKPTRENKEFIDKTRKEGVFHADVGQKPYSRLESSIESHLVPMYNPHHSVDDTLKIRFEQIDQDQFVTPIKALSPNFPVSLGSRNIAEVYQRININPNAKHQALISSDSAFLYKGKLKENTLQNLFDFNLRKHVKKLRPILKRKENSDMFPFEVGQGGETVATYRNADELINSYEFKEGHWELLEHPKIVNAIREAGYDGSIVTEMYTINGVRQRLKQLQIYDGSLVEDLELIIDTLPDLYKRLDHLKKNGQIYRSALAESGFSDQIHNKINKNNQAIEFVENLILKKDGKIRKVGEENFSEDELKLLEEQGYIGKVEEDNIVDISKKTLEEDDLSFMDVGVTGGENLGDLSKIGDDSLDKVKEATRRYEAGLDAGELSKGDPRLGEDNVRNLFPRKSEINSNISKSYYTDNDDVKQLLYYEGYNADAVNPRYQNNLKEIINTNSDSVYHETSLDGMRNILKETLMRGVRVNRGNRFEVSDNIDLALGQGGKNYIIEFDPISLQGTKNTTKPVAGFIDQTGVGAEYVVNTTTRASVKAIYVPNQKAFDKLKESFFTKSSKIKKEAYTDQDGSNSFFDFNNATKTERGIRIPFRGK